LRRGCSDKNFIPSTKEVCYHCYDLNGCNRWPIRSCYHCSSLETPECANWQQNDMNIKRTNCTHPNELCVSTVVEKLAFKYTIRGCASHIPECTANDPYCVRCNGSLCNYHPTSWPLTSTHISYHSIANVQRNGQGQSIKNSLSLALVQILSFLFILR